MLKQDPSFRFTGEVTNIEQTTHRDWVKYPENTDPDEFIRIHEGDLKLLIDNINGMRFLVEINNIWKYGEQIFWRRIKGKDVAYYDVSRSEEVDLKDEESFHVQIANRVTLKLFERLDKIMRHPSNEELDERIKRSTKKLFKRIMDRKHLHFMKKLFKYNEKYVKKPDTSNDELPLIL